MGSTWTLLPSNREMFDLTSKDFTRGDCEECGGPGWVNESDVCLSCMSQFSNSAEFAELVANLLDELDQKKREN